MLGWSLLSCDAVWTVYFIYLTRREFASGRWWCALAARTLIVCLAFLAFKQGV